MFCLRPSDYFHFAEKSLTAASLCCLCLLSAQGSRDEPQRAGGRRGPWDSGPRPSLDSVHTPVQRPQQAARAPPRLTPGTATQETDSSRAGCPDSICPRYKLRSPSGGRLHTKGCRAHTDSDSLTRRALVHPNESDRQFPSLGAAAKRKLIPAPDAGLRDAHRALEARSPHGARVRVALARAWRV